MSPPQGEAIALRAIGPGGPVPAVVAVLHELLARAEAGEIIGIAIGAACNGRCDASVYEIGEGNIASLVLALERCKQRLLMEGE